MCQTQFVPGTCLFRSCSQTITGRRLTYSRALQIIQTEEYLNEADLDVIRRSDDHWNEYNYGKDL